MSEEVGWGEVGDGEGRSKGEDEVFTARSPLSTSLAPALPLIPRP